MRLVELKSAIWIGLMDSEWIYCVWHWDCVTVGLCDSGTVWQWDWVTLGLCHIGTGWHWDCVTLGLCDIGTVWHWDCVTLGLRYIGTAWHSDCVTLGLCDIGTVWHWDCVTLGLGDIGTGWRIGTVDRKTANWLRMERIYHFGIVTSQLYGNEWCDIKRGRFTDTKLHQRDCCEKLGLKFNVGELCVDVELKGTASYFDDIKYANIKVTDWGRELENRNVKITCKNYLYLCA